MMTMARHQIGSQLVYWQGPGWYTPRPAGGLTTWMLVGQVATQPPGGCPAQWADMPTKLIQQILDEMTDALWVQRGGAN